MTTRSLYVSKRLVSSVFVFSLRKVLSQFSSNSLALRSRPFPRTGPVHLWLPFAFCGKGGKQISFKSTTNHEQARRKTVPSEILMFISTSTDFQQHTQQKLLKQTFGAVIYSYLSISCLSFVRSQNIPKKTSRNPPSSRAVRYPLRKRERVPWWKRSDEAWHSSVKSSRYLKKKHRKLFQPSIFLFQWLYVTRATGFFNLFEEMVHLPSEGLATEHLLWSIGRRPPSKTGDQTNPRVSSWVRQWYNCNKDIKQKSNITDNKNLARI